MDYDYILEHSLGGVYGQALGDSFGIPAMLRPEVTEKLFGWITDFQTPPLDHPAHGGFPAGHITDDTEQAMTLAKIFIRDQKVSVEGTVEGICQWYDWIDGDNSKYVGPSSRKAIQALKKGADPYKTGLSGDTNGSGMRVSPVGIMNAGNPKQACEDALLTCVPSHYTMTAVSGTCAVAAGIARGMMPGSTVEDVIETGIKAADEYFWKGSPWFASSIARKIKFGVDIANDKSKSIKQRLLDIYDFVGGGFLASEAIPSAFAIFAMAEGDVMNTAELATNMSGDSDTIGAMAVALAGARAGFSKFPDKVIEKIDTVNDVWNFREIAKGLADIAYKRLEK